MDNDGFWWIVAFLVVIWLVRGKSSTSEGKAPSYKSRCSQCNDTKRRTCFQCLGTGRIGNFHALGKSEACPMCQGSGKVVCSCN